MFVGLYSSLFRLLVASEGFFLAFINFSIYSVSPRIAGCGSRLALLAEEKEGRGPGPEVTIPDVSDAGFGAL